tara:strand:- start:76 stop:198 length:123 start_codon:yes stop_codon:yes gene_type:complete
MAINKPNKSDLSPLLVVNSEKVMEWIKNYIKPTPNKTNND